MGAKCWNTVGSYRCICKTGYIGNGTYCYKGQCTDEAFCGKNEQCISPTGFDCECKKGFFRTSVDGVCEDTDECGSNMHSCPQTSLCTNKPGTYECECKEGYTGRACSDIDECSTKTHQCANNQTCENTIGSYECKCNEGLYKGLTGRCADVDECSTKSHNCPQKSMCVNKIGIFECDCITGYKGQLCDDINECSAKTHQCNEKQTCTNNDGSYICTCKEGFNELSDDFCVDIDECSANTYTCPLKSVCVNKYGHYGCDCIKGYEGKNCSDIDECSAKTHQCNEKQNCENNEGSYSCNCKTGYDQVSDDSCSDINECSSNSHDCQLGFICKNTVGSFWCHDHRKKENVLVLNTYKSKKAVLISGEGQSQPKFEYGSETSVYSSCSMTYRNIFYVFGGTDTFKRQVSKLSGNRLERIGDLDFDLHAGACANVNNEYIYLCFSSPDHDELRQCRYSSGVEKTFRKTAKSVDRHESITIAASKSKYKSSYPRGLSFLEHILAVGNFADHARAELLDTRSGTWLSVASYPYVTGLYLLVCFRNLLRTQPA